MTRRELCLRAFPRAWRARYAQELCDLLAAQGGAPWAQDRDLLRAGLRERAHRLHPALRRAGVVIPAACALSAILPGVIAPGGRVPATTPLALVRPTVRRTTAPVIVLHEVRPRLSAPLPRAALPPRVARRRVAVTVRTRPPLTAPVLVAARPG